MTKSPLEFYDEELSRTIRQIQLALAAVQQDDDDNDNVTTRTHLANVDKWLNASRVFLHHMQMAVQELPSSVSSSSSSSQRQRRRLRGTTITDTTTDSKAQWTEMLSFRQETLAILTTERAKVNYKVAASAATTTLSSSSS